MFNDYRAIINFIRSLKKLNDEDFDKITESIVDIEKSQQKYRDNAFYHTPRSLAERVQSELLISKGDIVFDPTCGHGMLLKSLSHKGVQVRGIELTDALSSIAKEFLEKEYGYDNAYITQANTLDIPWEKVEDYNILIANPPFGLRCGNVEIPIFEKMLQAMETGKVKQIITIFPSNFVQKNNERGKLKGFMDRVHKAGYYLEESETFQEEFDNTSVSVRYFNFKKNLLSDYNFVPSLNKPKLTDKIVSQPLFQISKSDNGQFFISIVEKVLKNEKLNIEELLKIKIPNIIHKNKKIIKNNKIFEVSKIVGTKDFGNNKIYFDDYIFQEVLIKAQSRDAFDDIFGDFSFYKILKDVFKKLNIIDKINDSIKIDKYATIFEIIGTFSYVGDIAFKLQKTDNKKFYEDIKLIEYIVRNYKNILIGNNINNVPYRILKIIGYDDNIMNRDKITDEQLIEAYRNNTDNYILDFIDNIIEIIGNNSFEVYKKIREINISNQILYKSIKEDFTKDDIRDYIKEITKFGLVRNNDVYKVILGEKLKKDKDFLKVYKNIESIGYKTLDTQEFIYTLNTINGNKLNDKNEIDDLNNFIKENNNHLKHLLPYQVDGYRKAIEGIEKYNGFIISDDVGLGKTLVGSAVIGDYLENTNKKILLIAPKSVIDGGAWEKTLEFIGFDKNTIKDRVIVTNNSVSNFAKYKDDKNIGIIVLDEAHNFRNNDTQRYDEIKTFQSNGNNIVPVLCLTATPINNSILDLVNIISIFYPIIKQGLDENTIINDKYYWKSLTQYVSKYDRKRIVELFGEIEINGAKIKDEYPVIRYMNTQDSEEYKNFMTNFINDTFKYGVDIKTLDNINYSQKELEDEYIEDITELFKGIDKTNISYNTIKDEINNIFASIKKSNNFLLYLKILQDKNNNYNVSNITKILSEIENIYKNKISNYFTNIWLDKVNTEIKPYFEQTIKNDTNNFEYRKNSGHTDRIKGYEHRINMAQDGIDYIKDALDEKSLGLYLYDIRKNYNRLQKMDYSVEANDKGLVGGLKKEIKSLLGELILNFKNELNKLGKEIINVKKESKKGGIFSSLLGTMVLKRLDSSPYALYKTLVNISEKGEIIPEDDEEKKVKSNWGIKPLTQDERRKIGEITGKYKDFLLNAENDSKLKELKTLIGNEADKQWLIFTAYTDTLEYIYDNLKKQFPNLRIETLTGQSSSKERLDKISRFSPKVNGVNKEADIDILIATDTLSEGVNLHDVYRGVNYDLPYNPVRLQQRVGRLFRVGAKNTPVFYNFVPTTLMEELTGIMNIISSKENIIKTFFGEVNINIEDSNDLKKIIDNKINIGKKGTIDYNEIVADERKMDIFINPNKDTDNSKILEITNKYGYRKVDLDKINIYYKDISLEKGITEALIIPIYHGQIVKNINIDYLGNRNKEYFNNEYYSRLEKLYDLSGDNKLSPYGAMYFIINKLLHIDYIEVDNYKQNYKSKILLLKDIINILGNNNDDIKYMIAFV